MEAKVREKPMMTQILRLALVTHPTLATPRKKPPLLLPHALLWLLLAPLRHLQSQLHLVERQRLKPRVKPRLKKLRKKERKRPRKRKMRRRRRSPRSSKRPKRRSMMQRRTPKKL